jgi:asparagine synthase (glutamine-hydrolysing)
MFPFHFIGYWGDRRKEFLTQRRKGAKEEGNFFWDVIYVGCESVPVLPQNMIAGISAGGFSDAFDVWVRVEEDRLILGREAFGRVSLFWTRQGGVLWFASQLQLLLEVIEKPEINIFESTNKLFE